MSASITTGAEFICYAQSSIISDFAVYKSLCESICQMLATSLWDPNTSSSLEQDGCRWEKHKNTGVTDNFNNCENLNQQSGLTPYGVN